MGRAATPGRASASSTARTDHAEIYFIVNNNERWEDVDGLFRAGGRSPELWDPTDGSTRMQHRFTPGDDVTRVHLRLPPGGSTFVVFRRSSDRADPVVASYEASAPPDLPDPDVAHGDTPNGPAWLTSGDDDAAGEFIIYDLGAATDLGHVDIWNFHDLTRGLLNRGIHTMDVAVSTDGSMFTEVSRAELRRAPEIGERGYQQRVSIPAERARYVRFKVISNQGNDWIGRTNFVGVSRVNFYGATGEPIDDVRVHAHSSGLAHDPATDDDHPRARPPIELVTDAAGRTTAYTWWDGVDVAIRRGQVVTTIREADPPPVVEISGPWRVRFQADRGAPAQVDFPSLISWTEHTDQSVRHFSGIAEYTTTFTAPDDMSAGDTHVELDLGRVAGVARVTLNGRDLGVLWKPPFAVRITGLLRPGENELRVEIANTWHNRLVGDAALEPDERITSTNVRRPFAPHTPLLESGLLGPVRLHAAHVTTIDDGSSATAARETRP
jgi:hypothetical protein